MKKPPKTYQTNRLELRSAREGDGRQLNEAITVSLDSFFPWLSFSHRLYSDEELEEVSKLGQTRFESEEAFVWRAWNDDEVLVGSVDLKETVDADDVYRIGYWLRSDFSGQGLAQEMVSAVLEIATHHLLAKRIEAWCDVRNSRSCRFAESLGFKLERIAEKDYTDAAGRVSDSKVYVLDLLEDEFSK